MTQDLGKMTCERKNGQERFVSGDIDLGFDLLSFWRWSASDIVSNTLRGVLAEYLVARAIGLGETDIREEWAMYDLESPEGIKIEVKSSGYVQTWAQTKLSTIQFGYRRTIGFDTTTNLPLTEAKRHADVYVFALLHNTDQNTLNPLDTSQWRFYVVPTPVLDERTRSQTSITLRSLETIAGTGVSFDQLRDEIRRAVSGGPDPSGVAPADSAKPPDQI